MTTLIPKFRGNVEKGKLILDDQDGFIRYLAANFDGEVDVMVQKRRKSRSNNQNRYMYGIALQMLSEFTGHSVEEIKTWLKKEYGWVKQVKIGGKVHSIPRSTADLSTSEFEELMSQIRRQGDKLGIYIPQPNEIL